MELMNLKLSLVASVFFLLTALALVTATACPSHASAAQPQHSGNAQSSTITVIIRDFTFNPATVTVHTGDTVVWKNEDSVPHSATADTDAQKPAFDSGAIQKGTAWQFIARSKGTYKYTCTFHPNMEGTLIVQ